jgi:hypothetical protein
MTDLIVMRLADMHRVHPDQIEAKCSQCGEVVGVYPSGQRVMREMPGIKLVCQVCRQPTDVTVLAPGALSEPFDTRRKQ